MKKIISLLLFTAIILSFASCGTSKDDSSDASKAAGLTKITFVLDWTPNTNHTGLYVAQKLGYFKDAGLEVKIVDAPEDGALPLVANNGAQFGVSFQEDVGLALTGDSPMPVTAVSAILQHNTSGIVSLKSKGIDSFKKLEGKKYATWDLPIEKATIKQVMQKQGGDFSKLKLIPSTVTNTLAALEGNDFDAIWIFYGWDGIAAEVKGVETNYLPFIDVDPVFDFYTPVIIANNDFLKNSPDVAKKFMKAVSKGYEYAVANPKESADIICEAAPEIDKQIALKSQEYLAKQYIADASRWGYIDKTRWTNFFKWVDKNVTNISDTAMNGFTNEYLD